MLQKVNKQENTLDEMKIIQNYLDNNPQLLKRKGGNQGGGRAVGSHILNEGNILEVVEPVAEITAKEANKMIKKPRKPRVLTDEQKEKINLCLAKGRETLKLKRDEERKAKEALIVKPPPKVIKRSTVPEGYTGETVVKQYIIKADKPRKVSKVVKDEEDEETDYPTSESEMSDNTLINKIKRKTRAIKKIDNILSTAPSKRDPFRR